MQGDQYHGEFVVLTELSTKKCGAHAGVSMQGGENLTRASFLEQSKRSNPAGPKLAHAHLPVKKMHSTGVSSIFGPH